MTDSNNKNDNKAPGAIKEDRFGAALRGESALGVGDILQRSWDITTRTLPVMLLALAIVIVVAVITDVLMRSLLGIEMTEEVTGWPVLAQNIVGVIVLAPFSAAMILVGVRNAQDREVTVGLFSEGYKHTIQVMLAGLYTSVPMSLLTVIVVSSSSGDSLWPTLALAVVGVYVQISIMLAVPLVVDRGLVAHRALVASWIMTNRKFFTLFLFMILLAIIIVISALPLLLGLFFTLPMAVNATGVIYNRLVGVEDKTTNDFVSKEEA